MIDIENKVLNFIEKHNLLGTTKKIYVATSGGADSMAMLAFMHKFKESLDIEVGAVHVNHGTRGETANRDELFVEEFCKKHKIEFISFNANKDNVELPENASEDWARQLRYNYFSTITKKGVKVATAHTVSDQAETIIYRLARGGSGLKGMSGIPVKRDAYIRPFLCLTRTEIEALVEYYGTGNITDETNLGDDYARNKIRHYVIPVLKEINPNAEDSINKFCERMDKAYKYVEKLAKMQLNIGECVPGLSYNIDVFIGQDEFVLEEMLLQLLGNVGKQSEQLLSELKKYVNNVNKNDTQEEVAGILQLSEELSVVVSNKYITICDSTENYRRECLVGNNTFGIHGYSLEVEELDQIGFKYNCRSKFDLCNYADASLLDLKKCIIRSREDGDTFTPAKKMGGKLTKFMRNIPRANKLSVPVIEYNGKLIWVWGLGFTDGFTPTEDSEEIYKFSWF